MLKHHSKYCFVLDLKYIFVLILLERELWTKERKLKLGQVGVGSNIAQNHTRLAYRELFAQMHMKSWPKVSCVFIFVERHLTTQ